MEINLFEENAPLRFEHILVYPYPDLTRLWVRMWLTPQMGGEPPNVELRVYNPDGTENNSLVLLAQTDPKLNNTLHLRNPQPGATYRVEAELSVGLRKDAEIVDRRVFDLTLEFRDPDKGEPGFGIGLEEWFSPEASPGDARR